jgi:hypothetical protein
MTLGQKRGGALVGCLLLFSVLCAEESPGFSPVDSNLEKLESWMTDLLNTEVQQQQQLLNLSQTLEESGQMLKERELLLTDLRSQLTEISEIYRKQSSLSKKYEAKSRFWRNFTLIGIPLAVVSGLTVGLVMGR